MLLTTELGLDDCTGKALIKISVTVDLLSIYFVPSTQSPQVMNCWNKLLRQPELTVAQSFQPVQISNWTVYCLKFHVSWVVLHELRQGHQQHTPSSSLLVAILKGPGATVPLANSLCSFQHELILFQFTECLQKTRKHKENLCEFSFKNG